MKTSRPLASFLFYLTRITAAAYFVTAVYSIITIAFSTSSMQTIRDGAGLKIKFPFSETGFLLLDNNVSYITEVMAFFILYGLFFLLLGDVFDTFRQPKLFTALSIKRLTRFYQLNFIVPPVFLLIHLVIRYEVGTMIIIWFLHLVIGVFAYFMAAIFRQGVNLQNEQDLYI